MRGQTMVETMMPEGLSAASQAVWRAMLAQHHFETHELSALANALRWEDQSTALLIDAAAATEPARSKLLKLGMDAATCSLRFWRSLKFRDGDTARRPGRPSGDAWSAKRKLQKIG